MTMEIRSCSREAAAIFAENLQHNKIRPWELEQTVAEIPGHAPLLVITAGSPIGEINVHNDSIPLQLIDEQFYLITKTGDDDSDPFKVAHTVQGFEATGGIINGIRTEQPSFRIDIERGIIFRIT
jgi:hypothetical protein